jgi:plastocyanin
VGSATITFESPGVYRFHCILVDDNTGTKHSALGMTGTIDVAPG